VHVLLVYPNKPRLTYGTMPGPYGLETLRAHFIAAGIDSHIVNPYLSLDPKAVLAAALRRDTALIGVSVRNLDNALTLWDPVTSQEGLQTESCLGDVEDTLSWLRALAPGIPLVLGGAAFGQMPRPLLDYLGADAGFLGASEYDFIRLAQSLARGRRLVDALLPLTSAIHGAASAGLPRKSSHDAPQICPPVIEREAVYFRFRSEAAVRTFSGCPLSCGHCIEHLATRQVRKSRPEHVLREMTGVVLRYPEVRRFFFADSEVNLAGEERASHLVKAIRHTEALKDISLVGYFNPRPASFEFISHLTSVGCEMRFTVDHVADTILKRNGKNFGNAHVRALVHHHSDLGLPFSFCLLLGQPGESQATVDEVLRFVDSIPQSAQGPIYFSPGVRVYPGTPIARALTEGKLDRKWLVGDLASDYPFVRPVVYCEDKRPSELFEYVMRRAGGRIQPMNPYLCGLSGRDKNRLESEFSNYCVGLAQRDEDHEAAWRAWSTVSPDAPFLSARQRRDLLWVRGRLALQNGYSKKAVTDWVELQRQIANSESGSRLPDELTHNIQVARAVTQANEAESRLLSFTASNSAHYE